MGWESLQEGILYLSNLSESRIYVISILFDGVLVEGIGYRPIQSFLSSKEEVGKWSVSKFESMNISIEAGVG